MLPHNSNEAGAGTRNAIESRYKPMKQRRTARENVLLVALALMVLGMFFFRRPLQREFLAVCVLRAEAPSPAVIKELAESYQDRSIPLKRLWHSNKLPHRLAAFRYLESTPQNERELLTRLETELAASAQDVDFETRELAFALLSRAKHPGLLRLSLLQLRDSDPAVRLLGLQHLRQCGGVQLLKTVIPLLDDSDLSVVATAGSLVQRWSGHDFGIRVSQALPQFSRPEPVELNPADLATLAGGVKRAKAWWEKHQNKDSSPPTLWTKDVPSPPSLAPTFSVEDMNGAKIRLPRSPREAVVLVFWETATPMSLKYLKDMTRNQNGSAEHPGVLGISLDTTALERSHEHEHAHDHNHGNDSSEGNETAGLRRKLQDLSATESLNIPVFVDASGETARLFNVTQVPTTVLIDSDGYLRRRFVGVRTPETLMAMLQEIEAKNR